MTNTFTRGDRVTKITGDYSFDGTIDSVFTKQDGKTRLVAEDDRGLLHIYSENNLRHIGNEADHQYLKVMRKLIDKGVKRAGRNGHITYGLFGEQLRFNLQDGFPLLTTKRLHFKSILVELLWFLRGDTNIKYLHEHGVTIWDEWADKDGNLGPVYGKQWRAWPTGKHVAQKDSDGHTWHNPETIDQVAKLLEGLKKDPHGRRHIISAWNPAEVDQMALPPCHAFVQFHVANGFLNCMLTQRSADWFLGVPFNLASYALLTTIIAKEVGLAPGEFIHSFGDLHLYANHVEQAEEQLTRVPRDLPDLVIDSYKTRNKSIFELEPDDFYLTDYRPHDSIKAQVAA